MKSTNTKLISQIETPRLILKPIEIDDASAYFEAESASIKEISLYWSWAKCGKSIDDIKEFINFALECHMKAQPEQMYFALFSKVNYQFLGLIWIIRINWFVPWFEIAYWLDTRETGKGYMTEAVNALSRACFTVYNAKRISVKIFVNNYKSKAIPIRLGFQMEGELENYFIDFVREEITNCLLYSCCNINNLPHLKIDIWE